MARPKKYKRPMVKPFHLPTMLPAKGSVSEPSGQCTGNSKRPKGLKWHAVVSFAKDCYPFGMVIPGRSNEVGYRDATIEYTLSIFFSVRDWLINIMSGPLFVLCQNSRKHTYQTKFLVNNFIQKASEKHLFCVFL